MSTNRKNQISRTASGRALDARAPSGSEEVDALLRAATAPAGAEELSGLDRATAQFRLAAPALTERHDMLRTSARTFTAKAIALSVVAVGGIGGVALAADQGVIDVPGISHREKDKAPKEKKQTPAPRPSLAGLCKAYQASDSAQRLDNPAFTALTTAAGGAENVTTYCVELVGEKETGAQGPKDEKPGQGKGRDKEKTKGKSGQEHGQSGQEHGQSGEQHGQSGQEHGQSGEEHGNAPEHAADPEQPGKNRDKGKPAEPGKPDHAADPEQPGKNKDKGAEENQEQATA